MGFPAPVLSILHDQRRLDDRDKFWATLVDKNPLLDPRRDGAEDRGQTIDAVQSYLINYWPKQWSHEHKKWDEDDTQQVWLPEDLAFAGLLPYVEMGGPGGIPKYQGIFLDELQRLLQIAISSSRAEGASLEFLLQQPVITEEQRSGQRDPRRLATLASGSNADDIKCDACKGLYASQHTCTGSTIFSKLLRQVQHLSSKCARVDQILDVLTNESVASGGVLEFRGLTFIVKPSHSEKSVRQASKKKSWDESANSKKNLDQIMKLAYEFLSVLRGYWNAGKHTSLKSAMAGTLKFSEHHLGNHLGKDKCDLFKFGKITLHAYDRHMKILNGLHFL